MTPLTDEAVLSYRDLMLEMRADIKAVNEKLARLELEGTHSSHDLKADMVDHEERIRGLERFRWAVPMNTLLSFGAIIFTAVFNFALRAHHS